MNLSKRRQNRFGSERKFSTKLSANAPPKPAPTSWRRCSTTGLDSIAFSSHRSWRSLAFAQASMPSVYIKTYGCQMNERDSEQVAAQLVAKGYSLAPSEATADVILLNTCSVRDMAEQKALGKMATLAANVRRNRPNVILGFMGCMAQSRGRELIDRLPDVDLVVGTQKFHRAPDYIGEILAGRREKIVDVAEEVGSQSTIREHLLNGASAKSVTGFVGIMQG